MMVRLGAVLDSPALEGGRSLLMPDVVAWGAWGMSGTQWLLLGLAAVSGAAAAWATVLLIVFPVHGTGLPGRLSLRGLIGLHAGDFAAFADTHLLADFPSPRRLFEQLGPDRFRREFSHALRARIDEHVDDVMTRRNGQSWGGLSVYARNRVYAHVHRRLPYVIDDFVDQIQRDLDDIVRPSILLNRHFAENPALLSRLFLEAFGRDLRAMLPVAALLGAGAGYLCMGWGTGPWSLAFMLAAAALTGSALLLLLLGRLPGRIAVWPMPGDGVLHLRRRRFLQALARHTANDAFAWRMVIGELLHGAHASRVRQILKREVSGILDAPVFKVTLQFLLGPEGVYEVKSSAIEKAMELLSTTPVSAALRESYREDVERTLVHAAAGIPDGQYTELWGRLLLRAWKILPPALALAGFGIGWAAGWVLAPG